MRCALHGCLIRSKRHVWPSIVLASVIAIPSIQANQQAAQQPADTVQMQVKLATVTRGTLHPMHEFTGHITAMPSAVTVLSRAYEGQVTRLFVQAGAQVTQGMPLLTIRTTATTRQQVARAKASLDFAHRHLDQIRQKLKAQLATLLDLAQAEHTLVLAKADWQSLVASGATQPEHTIKATRSGLIQQLNVQLGGVFLANQPLLTFVDAGALEGTIPVPVAIAAQLGEGQSVTIAPVFGDAPAQSATIAAIDAIVLPQSNRQPVRLTLPKADQAHSMTGWVMGQAISARFTLPGKEGFILPHAALVTDQNGQTVIWLDKNHKAHRVPVHRLDTVDAHSVVLPVEKGALHRGDQVVVSGPSNIKEGMTLTTGSAS